MVPNKPKKGGGDGEEGGQWKLNEQVQGCDEHHQS